MANEGKEEPRYEGDALLLPGRVETLEHQAAEAKEREEQYRNEQITTNRRIATFTGLLVLCTLATAGVGLYQASISNTAANAAKTAAQAASDNAKTAADTLTEIKNSATDTHDLAIAAKDQSKAAVNQVTELESGVKESHALVKATQDSLDAMRANFTKDQRPYMWIKPSDPKFEEGKRLFWDVHFVNYGKSPAVKATMCTVLWYGPNDVRPDINQNAIDEKCKQVTANPNASRSIAPPGDAIFTTAASNVVLTADDIKILRDLDFRIAITGRITYGDVAGNPYSSTFCMVHLAAGGILNCEQYNEIK